MNIFQKAAELELHAEAFALATIISATGSTPRSKARMIITDNGEIFGTIGGGLAESYVIEEAKRRIILDESGVVTYRLATDGSVNSIDMLCGGDLDIYIEVISAPTHLVLFGGGHVNLEIARLAHSVGIAVIVAETRPEFADSQRFPMAKRLIVAPTIEKIMKELTFNSKTAVVIATHNHDFDPLNRLKGKELSYIGMLGSRKKVAHLKDKLRADGVSEDWIKRLRAPIGLDIGAETPQQIAVSVVAEIMHVGSHTSAMPLSSLAENLVIVRGAGDIATGTITRLHRCGFRVMALETEHPTVIRRTVSFAQAIIDGETVVEDIKALATTSYSEAKTFMDRGIIPIMADPQGNAIKAMNPTFVIDAILAKKNLGTKMNMAPFVVGLGPGFTAKHDVDAVVETNRGHDLGRVIWKGPAAADTGIPGTIAGVTEERVLRSPCEGNFMTIYSIGDSVKAGEIIATIDNMEVPATISGVIRGLLSSDMKVTKGFKIGDIDPRNDPDYCNRVSDKARAVAGGVVEAILAWKSGRICSDE